MGSYRFCPGKSTSPSMRADLMKSFMRLKVLNTVLFPQPDGPMIAVIFLLSICRATFFTARKLPYRIFRLRASAAIKEVGFVLSKSIMFGTCMFDWYCLFILSQKWL